MDVKLFTSVCLLFLGLEFINKAEACFPAIFWNSCNLPLCPVSGKCPGDPTATCRMDKTKCFGCKPTWYTKDNKKANCNPKKGAKLCPDGNKPMVCKKNNCKVLYCSHPSTIGVNCRQNTCAGCRPEYQVKESWYTCPPSLLNKVKAQPLPVKPCKQVPCNIDVCLNQRCQTQPNAVCRPDNCNTCTPAWFLNNEQVNCKTGEFISVTRTGPTAPLVKPKKPQVAPFQRQCALGEPRDFKCNYGICKDRTCRNFPHAQCRPNGCSGCSAEWFVGDKQVKCLSEECPPKVPVVRCVDDPCKHFGHYCPTAECRASQCGACEAKFYVDGVEIDCAMPPKQCPATVKARDCPFYECPSNTCPTNKRLMCRIDPCDPMKCYHDWVDIYNGEILGCRVFDGTEQAPPRVKPKKTSERHFFFDPLSPRFFGKKDGKRPLFVDLPVTPKPPMPKQKQPQGHQGPKHEFVPISVEGVISPPKGDPRTFIDPPAHAGGVFRNKQAFIPPGSTHTSQPASDHLPINHQPIIHSTDLDSFIGSFEHETAATSTDAIRDALKKYKPPGETGDVVPEPNIQKHIPKGSIGGKVIPPFKTTGTIFNKDQQFMQQTVKNAPIQHEPSHAGFKVEPIFNEPSPVQANSIDALIKSLSEGNSATSTDAVREALKIYKDPNAAPPLKPNVNPADSKAPVIPKHVAPQKKSQKFVNLPLNEQKPKAVVKSKPIYPELASNPTGSTQHGVKKNFFIPSLKPNVTPPRSRVVVRVTRKKKKTMRPIFNPNTSGVPLSIMLFERWAKSQ